MARGRRGVSSSGALASTLACGSLHRAALQPRWLRPLPQKTPLASLVEVLNNARNLRFARKKQRRMGRCFRAGKSVPPACVGWRRRSRRREGATRWSHAFAAQDWERSLRSRGKEGGGVLAGSGRSQRRCKAKRQARAPEGDTPARRTGDATKTAHETTGATKGKSCRARTLPRRRVSAGRPFPRNLLSRA